jgi:peptidylprolyl isomerase
MTEFVEIGGSAISLEAALQWRLLAGDNSLEDETVSSVSVLKYAAENDISVSSDEIQDFYNEWRYANELENAEATNIYMTENGLSGSSAQQFAEVGALRNKIRLSIDDDKVTEFFNENKPAYDVAEIYSITVESKDLADEIVSQLKDEEDSFLNLALEHSVDEDTYKQGGYVGEVTRSMVTAESEAGIFGASEGEIIGPFQNGDDFSIYMVRKVYPPVLDDIRETLRDELFEALMLAIQGDHIVDNKVLGTTKSAMDDDADDGEDLGEEE